MGKFSHAYYIYSVMQYLPWTMISSKEEVREEGKKGLRKPSPEEEAWQNRSCDLPNFTDMVKYLHKRVNTCILYTVVDITHVSSDKGS